MLKKGLFWIALVISLLLAVADYNLFKILPKMLAFNLHNTFALLVGFALLGLACHYIRKGRKYGYLMYLNAVIGLAMVVIHTVKLVVGHCI
jgi:hypothetical protein